MERRVAECQSPRWRRTPPAGKVRGLDVQARTPVGVACARLPLA